MQSHFRWTGSKVDEVKGELSGNYDVLTKDELLKGIPGYSQEQASLTMMIVFLFVIGTFVLAVFFYVQYPSPRFQQGYRVHVVFY